jgi:phage terminase large subunit-like protein
VWCFDTAGRWIDAGRWQKCYQTFTEDDLKGLPCYGGLDLSSTTDLTAFSLIFPQEDDEVKTLSWYWIPQKSMLDRIKSDRVPYDLWERERWIEATPGEVIDYDYIMGRIKKIKEEYKTVSDKETRRKLDLIAIMEKLERLIKIEREV